MEEHNLIVSNGASKRITAHSVAYAPDEGGTGSRVQGLSLCSFSQGLLKLAVGFIGPLDVAEEVFLMQI